MFVFITRPVLFFFVLLFFFSILLVLVQTSYFWLGFSCIDFHFYFIFSSAFCCWFYSEWERRDERYSPLFIDFLDLLYSRVFPLLLPFWICSFGQFSRRFASGWISVWRLFLVWGDCFPWFCLFVGFTSANRERLQSMRVGMEKDP